MSDDFREVTKKIIYAEDAINAINNHFGFSVEEEYGSAVQEVLNGLPSAQSEIVRCKDCKWYGFYSCELHGNDWMRDGNGFCDRAERRER